MPPKYITIEHKVPQPSFASVSYKQMWLPCIKDFTDGTLAAFPATITFPDGEKQEVEVGDKILFPAKYVAETTMEFMEMFFYQLPWYARLFKNL